MLKAAKVLKSNGTDGDLLIGLFDIAASDIDTTEPVFITFDGLPVPFFIESIQPKGTSRAIVHLTDISSLRDAEEVVGRDIFIDAEFEDEDGSEDFTGWTIYDREALLGKVSGMEPIPGNLCLYVETASGEAMIPLHEDFILGADPETKTLQLDLPEGLY